jgi:hypothetical protein
MNTKTILITLASALILIGLIKPDFSSWTNPESSPSNVLNVVDAPADPVLKEKADLVVKVFMSGQGNRKVDGVRLSGLYYDLATLIELDGKNEVVKNTDEIRQANALAGVMAHLDIKGKYPDLAQATNNVVVAGIGDENAVLSKELRAKAVDSFRALSWACYEGSK